MIQNKSSVSSGSLFQQIKTVLRNKILIYLGKSSQLLKKLKEFIRNQTETSNQPKDLILTSKTKRLLESKIHQNTTPLLIVMNTSNQEKPKKSNRISNYKQQSSMKIHQISTQRISEQQIHSLKNKNIIKRSTKQAHKSIKKKTKIKTNREK